MADPLVEKLVSTLRRFTMLHPGDSVLVAVSGGPDSVALLHVLVGLRAAWNLRPSAFHLNHLMRGRDSDEDARYVVDLCDSLQVPLSLEEFDVRAFAAAKGLSRQEAAREVRYRLLEKVARDLGARRIALGHNADDQVETVLMWLLRGAGMGGLSGIPPVRGMLIRPLMEIPRRDIEEYCRRENLAPRLDASNQKPIYLRNRIRLELVPFLERHFNPAVRLSILRVAEVAREEDSLLDRYARDNYRRLVRETSTADEGMPAVEFAPEDLRAIPRALERRLVRLCFERVRGDLRRLSLHHVDSVVRLAHAGKTGSVVELPGGVFVRLCYDRLVFQTHKGSREPARIYPKSLLKVPGVTEVKELGVRIRTELKEVTPGDIQAYVPPARCAGKGPKMLGFSHGALREAFDAGAVHLPLWVRGREAGDRLQPLGFPHMRKLKNVLIDAKIPREVRDSVPIIGDSDGILWAAGVRRSDRAKLARHTREIVVIDVEVMGVEYS